MDLYVSLFSVWVPELVKENNGQQAYFQLSKLTLSDFLASGCPAIDRQQQFCSSYQRYYYASIGYLTLKIISQLVHLLNLWNAVRVIQTDLKTNQVSWHR